MGQTAFPFESVLDVTPLTLLGNDTGSVSAAKALTPSQGRALLDVYSAGQTDTLLAAKAAASHTHLQSDVTGLTTALAAKADLVGGLVPANQLPSFVDDVLEYANLAAFPATGESGKIYVALDTSRTYRWGGSSYAELTDSTAVWGSISGVLSNQTDLVSALAGKSDTGHTHAYSSLTGIPSTFTPSAHGHAASDILSGTLDVARIPIGTTASTVCVGNDSRLSDARTPVAHKASHATGQPDALSPSDIGAVPTARTLTINGTALDLSADRSWTVSGGVGGSTGAVDNAVLRADGIGGSTVQNSGLTISDTLAMRIGDATNAGKMLLQDATAYSTTGVIQVLLGAPYLGQDLSSFYVRGNGEVYSYKGYICNTSQDGFTGHQFVFEGGWGWIRRAVSTPTGNGNGISNTYGLYITCGSGHGVSVAAGTSTTFIDVFNTYTNTTNYEKAILKFATYSSARYVQLAAESAGTGIANMNLVLSPKGTGALIAGPVPDGTATGGNARGANAVDLQTSRTAASQVASGSASFTAGKNNIASGLSAIAIGQDCSAQNSNAVAIGVNANASGTTAFAFGNFCRATNYASMAYGINSNATGNQAIALGSGTGSLASAQNSIAFGANARADRDFIFAYANGSFSNLEGAGDAQEVKWVLRNRTTDGATAVTLFANGSSARLTIPSGKILFATAQVVGSKSDGTAVATYMRKFAIKNVGGTTTLVGSVETIGTDVAAGTSLSITADDTNDAVNPAVIGVAGETWRWVMVVYGVELAYGT